MKPENAIEVKNITKKFKVYLDKGHTLKEKTLFRNRRKYEERSVLNGISFEVKKGEAVGLIGHNGCGKSTTLKLLTKIMYPDSGTIEMKGRVSSLIELGAGFHPDMSGRDNIYINASIFGLTKKEIDDRVEDIIAFSELEEFIDNPVRTYSSGMYMRLAFAVAINVNAEILLIDEILAVGDTNFQAKCFEKLREIKAKGTTIVIVSHSLGQIEQICDRSLWIDEGKIKEEGTPREVHPIYLDCMGKKRKERIEKQVNEKRNFEDVQKIGDNENTKKDVSERAEKTKELGNYSVRIIKAELIDGEGKASSIYTIGSKMILKVEYERCNKDVLECEFGFNIFRTDGVDCYGSNTLLDKMAKIVLKDHGSVLVEFNPVLLLQGRYNIDIAFHDELGMTYHHIYSAVTFDIINNYDEVGIGRIEHKWIVDGEELQRR